MPDIIVSDAKSGRKIKISYTGKPPSDEEIEQAFDSAQAPAAKPLPDVAPGSLFKPATVTGPVSAGTSGLSSIVGATQSAPLQVPISTGYRTGQLMGKMSNGKMVPYPAQTVDLNEPTLSVPRRSWLDNQIGFLANQQAESDIKGAPGQDLFSAGAITPLLQLQAAINRFTGRPKAAAMSISRLPNTGSGAFARAASEATPAAVENIMLGSLAGRAAGNFGVIPGIAAAIATPLIAPYVGLDFQKINRNLNKFIIGDQAQSILDQMQQSDRQNFKYQTLAGEVAPNLLFGLTDPSKVAANARFLRSVATRGSAAVAGELGETALLQRLAQSATNPSAADARFLEDISVKGSDAVAKALGKGEFARRVSEIIGDSTNAVLPTAFEAARQRAEGKFDPAALGITAAGGLLTMTPNHTGEAVGSVGEVPRLLVESARRFLPSPPEKPVFTLDPLRVGTVRYSPDGQPVEIVSHSSARPEIVQIKVPGSRFTQPRTREWVTANTIPSGPNGEFVPPSPAAETQIPVLTPESVSVGQPEATASIPTTESVPTSPQETENIKRPTIEPAPPPTAGEPSPYAMEPEETTGRKVTVSDKEFTLSPDQAEQWDRAAEIYREQKESSAKFSGDEKTKQGRLKALGMQYSAVKRKIVGISTNSDERNIAGAYQDLFKPKADTDVESEAWARKNPNAPTQEPTAAQGNRETRLVRTREGSVLYLSKNDAGLLSQTIGDSWEGAMLPGSKIGKVLDSLHDEIATQQEKGQNTDDLERLHDTLKFASDNRVGDVAIVDSSLPVEQVRATRREETAHLALKGLVTEPIVKAATEHPAWQTVSDALNRGGYEGSTDAVKAEEVIAKIGAGKFRELGLTQTEAKNLFKALVETGFKTHGDSFLLATEKATREYRGLANDTAEQARQQAIPTKAGAGGAESAGDGIDRGGNPGSERPPTDERFPDGGSGGTGQDVRPALSGGGRQPTRTDYLGQRAKERITRLTEALGENMKTLPENIQRGLSTWARTRNLSRGAIDSKIAPDTLQYELVHRGIAPPGKAQEGRALGFWVENTKSPEGHPDKHIWAESPYEAVRLHQLNQDDNVVRVERAERFQVKGKDGKGFYYNPDFKVTYADGRTVYEEIKPSTLRETEHVQRKAAAAKVYLNDLSKSAGRPYSYRIVTEAEMGPALFRAAKDETALKQFVPESQHLTLSDRLQSAAWQARRKQAQVADNDIRFARTPRVGDQFRGKESGNTFKAERVDESKKTVQVGVYNRDGMKLTSRPVSFEKWQGESRKAFGAKVRGIFADVINAPRTLQASLDLSAPLRQGAILTVTEPKLAAHAAVEMFRSLSTKNHEALIKSLADRPNAKLYEEAGLYLSTQQEEGHKGVSEREESFMSRLTAGLPGIKHSEQAYQAYLDTLRADSFDKFAKELSSRPEFKGKPEELQKAISDIAKFINVSTGRGELPAFLKDSADLLNGLLFSPRYAASRLQLMNPGTYAAMTPAARKIAVTHAVQFAGTVALFLTLAKLAGAEVSTDPDDSNFLKMKWGDWRYDIDAGMVQYLRFIFRMGAGFARNISGQGNERGKNPSDTAGRFARGKLSPVASFVADAATGKTFSGEKFNLASAIGERFLPLFGKDMFDAFKDEGMVGAAKLLPSMFGVGVSHYPERSGGAAGKSSLFGTGGGSGLPGLPSLPKLPGLPSLPKLPGLPGS